MTNIKDTIKQVQDEQDTLLDAESQMILDRIEAKARKRGIINEKKEQEEAYDRAMKGV